MHFSNLLAALLLLTATGALARAGPFQVNSTYPGSFHNITALPYHRNSSTPLPRPINCSTIMDPAVVKSYNATHMQIYNGRWVPHTPAMLTCILPSKNTTRVPAPTMGFPRPINRHNMTRLSTRPTATMNTARPLVPATTLVVPSQTTVVSTILATITATPKNSSSISSSSRVSTQPHSTHPHLPENTNDDFPDFVHNSNPEPELDDDESVGGRSVELPTGSLCFIHAVILLMVVLSVDLSPGSLHFILGVLLLMVVF
jgi:hypothetical protein